MQIEHILDEHDGVSIPADGADSEPFRAFRVINFQILRNFVCLISSAADDHHQRADEGDPVLVPAQGRLLLILVGRLDPVPPAVPVPAEAPAVVEGALIAGPAAENDHHAVCAARVAKRGRVVHPDAGLVVFGLEFVPRVRGLLQIQNPNVVDGHGARVAAEDDQKGLRENHGVPVSPAFESREGNYLAFGPRSEL